jgi:predicted TIM-barrel fold metal-dependent hydrolase
LVVKKTNIEKPKIPLIDGHNHLEILGSYWMEHSVEELLTMMDEMNVGVIVDLDGMENKEMLITHIERFKAKAPDRFYHMGGIDWSKWEEKGSKFGDWAAKQVEEQVKLGASGIKIWKNLGLHIKDPQGNLVKVDDPRLDPIFETAASLKIPVYMHISDPVAFFDPVDQFNERIDDLGEHPEWSFFWSPIPIFFRSYRAICQSDSSP